MEEKDLSPVVCHLFKKSEVKKHIFKNLSERRKYSTNIQQMSVLQCDDYKSFQYKEAVSENKSM